jgi:hypothetical protein
MKLRTDFKGLKYFLLKSKALRLYREYLKEVYKIPRPDLRDEYITELRTEFSKTKNVENEKKWDYLLAEGRQKLPLIKEMINRII